MRAASLAALLGCLLLLSACSRSTGVQTTAAAATPATKAAKPANEPAGLVRATGTIQAVRAFAVQVPQLVGPPTRITLVKLTPNGTRVNQGDLLAEFDHTEQTDAAREAQAKFEDLSHQVRQKTAQNRSDAEKRAAVLKQAEADLARADIQLRKGPILAELVRLQNEERATAARAHVASLKKSNHFHDVAEAAALRALELQTKRQEIALERARTNAEKLVLRAPIAGMVALENIWRGGSMGNAQEGDQLWPGQSLMKIFDPGEMEVHARVGEPEGAVLKAGAVAMVRLDAYPDTTFRAHLISASPVATTALGSPIKNFTARFRLEQNDSRLMPDLSAAVIIERMVGQKPEGAATGEARP